MSIAQLDALYAAYLAALDAADYDTAILKLMAMKARLASTPNLSRHLGSGGRQSIEWNPGELDSLIAQCRQLQTAAAVATGGIIQTSKIVYARPTA